MKATGIVRKVDELGRLVIPKELRKMLSIKNGDPVEIFSGEDETVILKKYVPSYESKIQTIERVIGELKSEEGNNHCVAIKELQSVLEILEQKSSQPAGTDCELRD